MCCLLEGLEIFEVLRFLRFSIEYQDFSIEDDVLKIIKKNLNGIANLSKERVYSEINKIINLNNLRDIFLSKDLYEIFKHYSLYGGLSLR